MSRIKDELIIDRPNEEPPDEVQFEPSGKCPEEMDVASIYEVFVNEPDCAPF